MIPISFKESNHIYKKPKDMTEDQCGDLEVFVGKDSEDFPVIISKWQLSKEDLEELNENGVIYLTIIGKGMPPVSIRTDNPFIDPENDKP